MFLSFSSEFLPARVLFFLLVIAVVVLQLVAYTSQHEYSSFAHHLEEIVLRSH